MATKSMDRPQASISQNRSLVWLVVGLFFIWGGATSLNDILIPKLKGLYSLSYAEVMLTQFAFFAAYFFASIPAGNLVARIGYVRGLVAGLSIMAFGALLFWPAAGSEAYWPYLAALFILAVGITVLQVAANPLIATLGESRSSSSRLTFAQAFNSLGTTIWPYIGAQLILGSGNFGSVAARSSETAVIGTIYLVIALVLALVALIFWMKRNSLPTSRPTSIGFADSMMLLKQPRIAFGAAALFVYVGAEVSIGSILVNYLELPGTLGLGPQAAGEHLSLYWGGAMIGRFAGSWLLKHVQPGKLLAGFAIGAALLVLVSMVSGGAMSGWSLISVGLLNSIMFPTVFSLALTGQGDKTPEASGLLCMAIVGGAIIPLATGSLADTYSIAAALIVPVCCYAIVAAFGWFARGSVEG